MENATIIAKAQTLLPNTSIRMTAEPQSYTVYNFNGVLLVGMGVECTLPPFYRNQKCHDLIDLKGAVIAKNVQKISL